MTGKSVTCTRSTRPAAISARFSDRLPCERSGTPDSSLSRATTSTASPLTTDASCQSRGPSSVVDTTVAGRLLIRVTHGSRTSGSSALEASIRANARYVLAPAVLERQGMPAVWRRSIAEALEVIDVLDARITPIEHELRPLARADARVILLDTIPGIGDLLGLTLASEIGDVARFG